MGPPLNRATSARLISPALALLAGLGLATATPAAGQSADPCRGVELGPRAECGHLTVLENPDGPATGRTIPIRYLVVRATRPSGREPVFLFAGGPGQGSTDLVGLATGPFAEVGATRDLVMVDQRGTGGSNPLACPIDLIPNPALAFGHVFDPEKFASCRVELERHADLKLYTTERAIVDVDRVREHLGYDKILVWGGSYGTRIGQAYVRGYPEHVAAAVIDGVVPFDFRAPAGYAASLQQSLDRVFADCAASAECDAANPDLPGAFGRLLEILRAGPQNVTIRRPDSSTASVRLSLGDFGYAVRGLLYSAGGGRRLPAMVTEADRSGDLTPFAQAYFNRAAGFNASFADGLHFAIFCAEDVGFIDPKEAPALVRGSFIGSYLIDEYSAICREWVRAPIGPHAREPLRTQVPVLVVSGWFDPVTPPEAGERVAGYLENARHLIVRNEAHGAGFGCAAKAVLHVLETASLEGLPEVCAGVRNLFDARR